MLQHKHCLRLYLQCCWRCVNSLKGFFLLTVQPKSLITSLYDSQRGLAFFNRQQPQENHKIYIPITTSPKLTGVISCGSCLNIMNLLDFQLSAGEGSYLSNLHDIALWSWDSDLIKCVIQGFRLSLLSVNQFTSLGEYFTAYHTSDRLLPLQE